MTPTPPYRCIYCGAPSWVDPSDQCPPPDYCHESDHGEPDDHVVALKRRHNEMYERGRDLLNQMEALADQVHGLRTEIAALEGDDYDPIRILFAGTFWIEGEQE